MKIGKKNIEHITLWSRGKNRDVYGNPYYAYKFVVKFKWARDYCTSSLVINCSANWGSSGESDCLRMAMNKLEKTFGIKLTWKDLHGKTPLITHHHRTVSTMAELEHPENWK